MSTLVIHCNVTQLYISKVTLMQTSCWQLVKTKPYLQTASREKLARRKNLLISGKKQL